MTVFMHEATADPFGIVGTFPAKFRRVATSTMNGDLISDRIRQVLEAWERFADVPAERSGDAANVTPPIDVMVHEPNGARLYPTTPLEAVEHLHDLLQVSHDAVLRAVGIAERTYYGWKKRPGSKPRVASLGRLWPMVESLSYLEGTHPNLAAWFHATPEAQEAFAAGKVNRMVQLELEWVNGRTEVGRVPAPHFGDPGDRVDGPFADPEVTEAEEPQLDAEAESMTRSAPRNRLRRQTPPRSR